jgi:hypothetical protein
MLSQNFCTFYSMTGSLVGYQDLPPSSYARPPPNFSHIFNQGSAQRQRYIACELKGSVVGVARAKQQTQEKDAGWK